MTNPKTAIFYPEEFKVDMDGKRNDWEGIVILPTMNHSILYKEYKKISTKSKSDISRIYKPCLESFEYKSKYGTIQSNVSINSIDL
jgi:5'-3' exonuclease